MAKIDVLSTTEYKNGSISVELELDDDAKKLLLEAGFNSILLDSLKNFQTDVETKIEDKVSTAFYIGNLLIYGENLSSVYTPEEAIAECDKLGKGWRLPTLDEMIILFKNKKEIGNLKELCFWTSDIFSGTMFFTGDGTVWVNTTPQSTYYFVRPVKSI